jgi:hypothetical protein
MRARSFVVVIALTTLLGAPATRADLVSFWQNNPISPQAVANDPALAGMQSWSLMATNRSGYFQWAALRAVLPPGNTFYRHPLGGSVRPNPALFSKHPALEFHTYMTSPQQIRGLSGGPTLIGGFPEGEPWSWGGTMDNIPGTFSMIWAHPKTVVWNIPPGTYEMMRGTFPAGVLPAVHPESEVGYIQERTPVPLVIPEPSALALVLLPWVVRTRVSRVSRASRAAGRIGWA